MPDPIQPRNPVPRARGVDPRAAGLVALLALALLGPGILGRELMPPDEPRFALVAAEMYERGDLLLPTRHGEAYLDKPPLLFWLACGAFALLGGPGEAAARLPSLAASVLLVVLSFACGSRWGGRRIGWLTAGVLAASVLFLLRAGWVVTDTLLAASVLGCVLSLDRAREGQALRFGSAAALCLAAGILAKGPITLLFVGLAALASLAAPAPRLSVRPLLRPVPLLVFAAALLPWPVALALRTGDAGWLVSAWFRQTAVRYVDSWDNLEPWWYYGEALFVGLLPWSLLLPVLLDRGARRAVAASRGARWMLAWGVAAAVVLSVPGGKRGVYLLPVLPAFAFVVATVLASRPARVPRRLAGGAALLAALLLGALAAAFVLDERGLGALPRGLPPSGALRAGIALLAGTWAAALAGMAWAAAARWRLVAWFPAAAALALGLAAPFVTGPALDASQGARAAAAELARLVPPGELVGTCRSKRELIDWYLDRPLASLESVDDVRRFLADGTGLVVCRDDQLPGAGLLPAGTDRIATVRIGRLPLRVVRPAGRGAHGVPSPPD